MRLSMWSSYLIELAPEKMVKTFVRHGWKYSELSDEHGWMLLNRGSPGVEGGKFRKYASNRGLSFPQGHFFLGADISEKNRREREKLLDILKKWCDLFNAVGVKAGVLHPGKLRRYRKKSTKDEAMSRVMEVLGEILDYSAGASFTVCLENLFREFRSFEDLRRVIDALGSERLGVCLDTGHLNMSGGDCAEFVLAAGNLLKALHVSDSIGPGQDHILPFGAGGVEWKKFIGALRDIGYKGLFNFEVPRENKCPMEIRLKKLDYAKSLAGAMLEMP